MKLPKGKPPVLAAQCVARLPEDTERAIGLILSRRSITQSDSGTILVEFERFGNDVEVVAHTLADVDNVDELLQEEDG